VITYLFVINGIFRGAGDASIAMRSLWIANICNIILCPTLIYGAGPIPAFGLTGAAIATAIGRGVGICYQVTHLLKGRGVLHIQKHHFTPAWEIIRSVVRLASTGTFQFIIASASWIVLARIIAEFGNTAIAGYIIAMRIMMFFLLPAWGLSNAAATLVGQNLGAGQPDRAEASVWKTAQYNAIFMAIVTTLFIFFGSSLASFVTQDEEVIRVATQAMRIVGLGYIAYGVSMVLTNAFNGAGDTRTPTIINFFAFWMFQIPLAYLLAITFDIKQMGVFVAILIAETGITIISAIIFRKGKWKAMKV
jgi:putative MATE family efflux protein